MEKNISNLLQKYFNESNALEAMLEKTNGVDTSEILSKKLVVGCLSRRVQISKIREKRFRRKLEKQRGESFL